MLTEDPHPEAAVGAELLQQTQLGRARLEAIRPVGEGVCWSDARLGSAAAGRTTGSTSTSIGCCSWEGWG
jgi:hypothetical protein